MSFLQDVLAARELPPLLSREEMIGKLLEGEYGHLPEEEYSMTVSEPHVLNRNMCAGKVIFSEVNLTIASAHGSHTFAVHTCLHNDGEKHPFFVYLHFPYSVYLSYPAEQIAEAGFDLLSFCYTDVTSDDGDFSTGLAGILPMDRVYGCGKIGYWSFAAMRVMDYAQTLPSLDLAQGAVVGHSRLGKTALVTGMLDTRFRYVISNDSGCSGASLSRGSMGQKGEMGAHGETGESISFMLRVLSHWFTENYARYGEKNCPDDFDQHYLIAAIAPRYAYVASAEMDDWADPRSEFLSCVAASGAWEKQGLSGFVCPDRYAEAGDVFHEGHIGYHRAEGKHFIGWHDFEKYIAFIRRHEKD